MNTEAGQEILNRSPMLREFLSGEITPKSYSAMGEYKRNMATWEGKVRITNLFAINSGIYTEKDHVYQNQALLFFLGYELSTSDNVNLFFKDILDVLKKENKITTSEYKKEITELIVFCTLASGAINRQKLDITDTKKEIPEIFTDFINGLDI